MQIYRIDLPLALSRKSKCARVCARAENEKREGGETQRGEKRAAKWAAFEGTERSTLPQILRSIVEMLAFRFRFPHLRCKAHQSVRIPRGMIRDYATTGYDEPFPIRDRISRARARAMIP